MGSAKKQNTRRWAVRRSRGKSWAVDRITAYGTRYYTKDFTRYFPTEEEAEAYKERREREDNAE